MKILAIDTTSTYTCAATCENGHVLAEYFADTNIKHSEALLPAIQQLLQQNQLNMNDIDMLAVAVGPGSFTGVRIGTATAKGLAFGREIPCVPVSSLEALAYNFNGQSGIICPVMDAKRGQYYNALFEWKADKLCRLTEDRLITFDELHAELAQYEGDIRLCGDAYEAVLAGMRTLDSGERFVESPPELTKNSACSVARVALAKYQADTSANYSDIALLPTYLRSSQAERERKIK